MARRDCVGRGGSTPTEELIHQALTVTEKEEVGRWCRVLMLVPVFCAHVLVMLVFLSTSPSWVVTPRPAPLPRWTLA